MKSKDIKPNDTLYLRKNVILFKDDDVETRIPVKTPLVVKNRYFTKDKQLESVNMHIVGSFIDIKVPVHKVEEYLANYSETLDLNEE